MEVIEKARRAQGMPMLEPCDLAEAIGFALGQCHILDLQFDGERERKPYLRFDLWLRTALYCDVIDFWRSPAGFGRHGQHRVPADDAGRQALDDTAGEHDGGGFGLNDGDVVGADRLDPASLVDAADRVDARRWLQSEADRDSAAPVGGSRRDADQAAQGLDDHAGVGARRPAGRGVAGASGAAAFVDCGGCGWRHYAQSPNGIAVWHLPAGCLSCGADLRIEAAA